MPATSHVLPRNGAGIQRSIMIILRRSVPRWAYDSMLYYVDVLGKPGEILHFRCAPVQNDVDVISSLLHRLCSTPDPLLELVSRPTLGGMRP
jgi:hypothetical protein